MVFCLNAALVYWIDICVLQSVCVHTHKQI